MVNSKMKEMQLPHLFFGNTCVSAIVLVAEEEGGETLDSRHGGGGNLFWDSSQTSFFHIRPDTRD